MRVPRRLAIFMTGIAGLFGMRTPPEPDVVAQMAPARGPESGRRGEPDPEDLAFVRRERRAVGEPDERTDIGL
jgi:hypothetical protein